jgi:hypothetical protein
VPLPGADTTVQPGPAPSTPGTAGNSIAAGLPVPAANPADPVDYVAWLQEQIFIDGPNAIPHYQAAVDNAVKWTGDDELFGRAMSGDPEALTAPEITAWLDANAEALEHFRAGTDFEFHGMPMETADGTLIGFLLPHLSKMRLLSKAAVIEAKKLEATGEYEAAMGYYLDTLAAGQHASEGPTLIENLVGIAIQALASDRLLDTFARDVDDVIDYVDVAQGLGERYGPARPMAESLQFERAMVLDIVQRGYETNPETGNYRVSENGLEAVSQAIRLVGNGGSPGQVALGFILGRIGFQEMNEQVNEHYDALTEAAGMPYQESQRAFDELHSELEDSALEYRNPLLGMLLPSFGRAAHLATRSDTNRRATLVIANLKAYHQRYGNYPDSLDVLGDDEMVIDPFTDEYFVYRRDGDDFVLYSLSSNGVDDGGIHDRRGQTNDLVYWPRPAKN